MIYKKILTQVPIKEKTYLKKVSLHAQSMCDEANMNKEDREY